MGVRLFINQTIEEYTTMLEILFLHNASVREISIQTTACIMKQIIHKQKIPLQICVLFSQFRQNIDVLEEAKLLQYLICRLISSL